MKSSTSTGMSSNRLRAHEDDDRHFQAAFAHQVDERGGLAFEALLAPVNHHAADRRVGLHGDLGVFEAARLDDLEAHAFDGGDDLVDPKALQIVGVEHRRREQEGEPLEEIHCDAPRRLEFVRPIAPASRPLC